MFKGPKIILQESPPQKKEKKKMKHKGVISLFDYFNESEEDSRKLDDESDHVIRTSTQQYLKVNETLNVYSSN